MLSHSVLTRWIRRGLLAASVAAVGLASPAAPPRVEAAGIVVNTLVDADPPVTNGLCSLREAVANANTNAATWPDCPAGTGVDTITFSGSGWIELVSSLPEITDPARLTIDGGGYSVTISGGLAGRPFTVTANAVAELRGLTVTYGKGLGFEFGGGGVRNAGTLTVRNTLVTENSTGGLYNTGTLTVIDSTVSRNSGLGSIGGGIGNTGTLTVMSSTVKNNSGFPDGGGIATSGTLSVSNSTISGNSGAIGGGIYVSGLGVATVFNSTISGNGLTLGGQGGGVNNQGSLTISNSIVVNNTAPTAPDCTGNVSTLGANLIGDLTGCAIIGTPPLTGDAKLAALADNGGPTETHALLPGSPAIDAGDDTVCAASPVSGQDQRGVARPQGPHCDLGSLETEPLFEPIGGRNLRITTGSIDLAWDTGTAQTSYSLLRYNTSTEATDLVPLPGTATSYSDASAVNGTVYCYVLFPFGPAGLLGLSDLLCGLTGISSGTAVPGGFALALNQTANATLTWTPPAGGVGSYLLQRIPLDGTAISNVLLGAGATSSVQPVTSAGTCFQLVAFRGIEFGTTNVLCGVPGVSTLSAGGRVASIGEVEERVAAVGRAVATATME